MRLTVAVVSCQLLSWPVLADAQQEAHGAMSPDQIGSTAVKFEISCAPAVKDDFNKAVLAQLRAVADAEDLTDKSAVSPGPLAPARELFGEMLLEAGRAREALVAFEATMKKEPNRFRGMYGAARAAETLGDRAKAATYYRQLLEVAKDADTERPELRHARTYLSRI